jgi:hypothetical protein
MLSISHKIYSFIKRLKPETYALKITANSFIMLVVSVSICLKTEKRK